MAVGHELVGYSRVTGNLEDCHDIPDGKVLEVARMLAHVDIDDPDIVDCYRLADICAEALAIQIGVKIDTYAHEYYLEGYAK